jgi:hypothetical protein
MTGARRCFVVGALALGVGCSSPPGAVVQPSAPAAAGGDAAPAAPVRGDASTAEPSPAATLAAARTRAQALFEAQLAAARAGDRAGLIATFDGHAVLLAHSDHLASDTVTAEWLSLTPSMQITAMSDVVFAAGGGDRAVWLVAQITLDERGASELHAEAASKTVLRISELATAAAGWKVVAVAVGVARVSDGYANIATMPQHTVPGPLTSLVGQLDAFTAAMADDTIALGPGPGDRIAIGAAARAAIAAWPPNLLAIDGEVREVRAGDVGFLQAHLADGPSLLVVATFRGRTPHVVLVHVLSL